MPKMFHHSSSTESSGAGKQAGLTWRSFVVCLVAMLLMGMWIEYEEVFSSGGPLAENSPPNGAVGVILLVIVLSGVLYKLRRALRLATAELVVIYSALVMAAPLMTQGMWHRMFGLMAAIPHNQDFTSYDSLPPMLWPHGDNLIANAQFRSGLDGFSHDGGGDLRMESVDRKELGLWSSPVLSNGGKTNSRSAVSFSVARCDAKGRQQLVPGETFLFAALVKAEGFTKGSAVFVNLKTDDGIAAPLLVSTEATKPTFAHRDGFKRIGIYPLAIPIGMRDKMTFSVGVRGEGNVTVQDLQFFNVEAITGGYAGRKIVRESDLDKLGEDERNFTLVKPDNMLSLAGLKFLLTGYIPLNQWARPAIAWTLLIGALFMGFLGLNVLMRKQWGENERFTFPLTILPRNLFADATDEQGHAHRAIFRNRIMWLGFAITLPLVLLKGIQFYYPGIPAPIFTDVRLSAYVNGSLAKSFLQNLNVGIGLSFSVVAICLLIETDILFSLWSMFLIFQTWFFLGQAFNLTRYPGYPWDHQQMMGAFIMFALLALFMGRHHLWRVLKLALGRRETDGHLDQSQEVVSYRTAFLLVLASLIMLIGWGIWTRMGAVASLLFFGYMLVCGFAASKIRAECGAPFSYMTPYYGMQFVAAIGGFAVFNSTGMLVATIAAGFMCTACFLLIAPVQVEMMELGRHFNVKPRDIGHGLTIGLLGGLFIGGFVVLAWAYGFGANTMKYSWAYEQNWYYNGFRTGELNADRALDSGTLGSTPETQTLNFSKNPDAKGLGIGVVTTVALAVLRARFMWFPFHPIGYILAPSHFMKMCWAGIFVAWLARMILLRVGGAQSIRRGLVPFCVGMFTACIVSIVIFDVVGLYLRFHGVVDVYSSIP